MISVICRYYLFHGTDPRAAMAISDTGLGFRV